MQPAGEATLLAGCVLCAALQHLSPGTQSHGVRQAEAHDSPDQRVEPADILIGRSRNDGEQGMQEIMMHLVSFVHGSTSINPYNRSHTLIPFLKPSQRFLMHIKFVSPSAPFPWFRPHFSKN